MEELLKDLMWYLFNRMSYRKVYRVVGETVVDASVELRCLANMGELLQGSTHNEIYLDSKLIAKTKLIWGILTVGEVNFNDRYDIIIRSIFQAIDVELVKFGKTWVAYPDGPGIEYPNKGEHTPKEIIIERQEKARNAQQYWEEGKVYANYAKTVQGYPLGTMSIGSYYGTYTSTGASTGTFTTGRSLTREDFHYPPWNEPVNAVLGPTPGTIPNNPILSTAQQRGMTQRQIEQLAHRGRVR